MQLTVCYGTLPLLFVLSTIMAVLFFVSPDVRFSTLRRIVSEGLGDLDKVLNRSSTHPSRSRGIPHH